MKKINSIIAGLTFFLLVPFVHAVEKGPCVFLADGSCGSDNVIKNAIPIIANLLISVSAGASVMFVVVGAFFMLLSLGEEGDISKGKMSVVYALIGLGITLMSQVVVSFVLVRFNNLPPPPGSNLTTYVSSQPDPIFDFMKSAVATMVFLFNSVFALMLVYAGFRMAFARGNTDEFNRARMILIWGIVGAVLVNVAYPLVNAVLNVPGLVVP